ncbi:Bifunctional transcriptional activator/DNA repair enzyme AdaA [Streptomyces sp. YIM 130001]|uniref:bifunctional transcriptional activator/DNA repair enzyme AdaA n=1 Tax=Streptomyces sp. YIM 130001 TaxID=2259644 RepID=UPI000E64C6CC|nr:DNA-3-methyladenine glycosylase 2 family protein [Streptomyces sp. YIM 130001]RII17618.1 Bifunctional transcriptional activator/DNA repair enzyme AdaA [Streptomyces sp. YIM 130001]
MDEETRYEAVCSRDARFDGAFFFAVSTTGIYCRPSCPAVTPKRRNVRFFPTAAGAQRAGFRACRRCRPDAVPGSADWNARADVVGRAMRMIGDGVVDRDGVTGLADRLGYSARQVQRQLTAELGAGPVALARAQRAHTARILLQTTPLPVTDIAFASGFASVRQFNDTIRQIYARTPSGLRAESRTGNGTARGASSGSARTAGVPLRLALRGPYHHASVFDLLALEALPGVEEMTGAAGSRTYRRTLRLPYGTGFASVDERDAGPWLDARIHLTDPRDLSTAVHRLRRLFDLDADPIAVDQRLGAQPALTALVAERPGLRSPGAADADEFAVRAVVGQAAAADLVAEFGAPLDVPCGSLTHLFPEPKALAAHLPLAAALEDGSVRLDAGADRDDAEQALLAVPGVRPAEAALIRRRALGDPDVAVPGERTDDAWRPWRSYAAHHLGTACRQETTASGPAA